MNKTLAISAIALIAAIMVVGTVSPTVFADKPEEKKNNGGNGCEKSNPNSKSCEKNPNSVTCQGCIDEYNAKILACGADFVCANAAHDELKLCVSPIANSCQIPPAPGV